MTKRQYRVTQIWDVTGDLPEEKILRYAAEHRVHITGCSIEHGCYAIDSLDGSAEIEEVKR